MPNTVFWIALQAWGINVRLSEQYREVGVDAGGRVARSSLVALGGRADALAEEREAVEQPEVNLTNLNPQTLRRIMADFGPEYPEVPTTSSKQPIVDGGGLGRFKLKAKLGSHGAFGQTYKAKVQDDTLVTEGVKKGDYVALKMLRRPKENHQQDVVRPEKHGCALLRRVHAKARRAGLDSGVLMKCFGHFDHEGRDYFVLSLAPGTDLERTIPGSLAIEKLKEKLARHVTHEVLRAVYLLSAPELGPPYVLHRDIKPGNVLFDGHSNQVTLVDFGVAIEFEPGAANAEDELYGDLAASAWTRWFGQRSPWAPPEIDLFPLEGTDCGGDISSFDVYSSAALHYALTTGRALDSGYFNPLDLPPRFASKAGPSLLPPVTADQQRGLHAKLAATSPREAAVLEGMFGAPAAGTVDRFLELREKHQRLAALRAELATPAVDASVTVSHAPLGLRVTKDGVLTGFSAAPEATRALEAAAGRPLEGCRIVRLGEAAYDASGAGYTAFLALAQAEPLVDYTLGLDCGAARAALGAEALEVTAACAALAAELREDLGPLEAAACARPSPAEAAATFGAALKGPPPGFHVLALAVEPVATGFGVQMDRAGKIAAVTPGSPADAAKIKPDCRLAEVVGGEAGKTLDQQFVKLWDKGKGAPFRVLVTC